MRAVAVVFIVLLAGCSGIDSEDSAAVALPEFPRESYTGIVGSQGYVQPLERLEGLDTTWDGQAGHHFLDVLQALDPDQALIVGVQVFEEQRLQVSAQGHLRATSASPPGALESGYRNGDVACENHFSARGVSARPWLERAGMDEDEMQWVDPGEGGKSKSRSTPWKTPNGWSGFNAGFDDEVKAGHWYVFGVGVANQHPASLVDAGSSFNVTVDAAGAHRLVILSRADMYCGHGFERWEDHGNASVGFSGHFEMASVYGMEVWFQPDYDRLADDVLVPLFGKGSGTMRVGSETWTLPKDGCLAVSRWDASDARLTVTDWIGDPYWLMYGFHNEFHGEGLADVFGCDPK